MKTCPKCGVEHVRKGVHCSRHCANSRPKVAVTCPTCQRVRLLPPSMAHRRYCGNACAKTVQKVPMVCKVCKRTKWLVPSIARRRQYCSRSCSSKGTRNCSREACRVGGHAAAQTKFTQWWESMMKRVSASAMSTMEAFRAGYLIGHRRGYRRAKRLTVDVR